MFSSTRVALLPSSVRELVVRRTSYAISRGTVGAAIQQRRGITIGQLDDGRDSKVMM